MQLDGFRPSPADLPQARKDPEDPRFIELFTSDASLADMVLCGLPFDGAVLGRKGARDGPTGIREAFWFIASHDPDNEADLADLRILDVGDLADTSGTVLEVHERARMHLANVFDLGRPTVVLGGDNSLSYPTVQALHEARGGRIGILVLDAHYDVRTWTDQPSSGTPYGRILEELPGRPVKATNLVHVGIRAYANTSHLAKRAEKLGLEPFTMGDVAADGIEAVIEEALEKATDGVDHLFLSVDADVMDQSSAPGVSAPGLGGLSLEEAAYAVTEAAMDPLCVGMDLLEIAPSLDLSGNTNRAGAYLVASFAGGLAVRRGRK